MGKDLKNMRKMIRKLKNLKNTLQIRKQNILVIYNNKPKSFVYLDCKMLRL